ncbi:MAG: AAA family ATPase [Clostridiales bacterium]|nr:AAA family ATPase [Clostridiales bacterium]
MERLQALRRIRLSEPLAEKVRPATLDDLVGQEEGLEALRAALCGPNPQHVLLYGPPGVGKTAAARLILEEARKDPLSPFGPDARLVEFDATIARWDERGIADPLLGSVHDPIYQGAGPLGVAGIPQPKPGAVTRAHGGILFLDEIGELHPVQLNKLLKVLEDRRVFLESAYYNPHDPHIPPHIRDIFENGLPADFRLVGATTRMPEEIPPALRSRCVEIFFRPLKPKELKIIGERAAERLGYRLTPEAAEVLVAYSQSGRDTVNLVQMAAEVARRRGLSVLEKEHIEWVASVGPYVPAPRPSFTRDPRVGSALALALQGPTSGLVLEVEAAVYLAQDKGDIRVSGLLEEEEVGRFRRTSMARASVDNVLSMLRRFLAVDPHQYHVYLNFLGNLPLDGPSAGVAMGLALYSAFTGEKLKPLVAATGEVTLQGDVRPVGGVRAKVEAAVDAGLEKVFIPQGNWQPSFAQLPIEVIPVGTFAEVLEGALWEGKSAAAHASR